MPRARSNAVTRRPARTRPRSNAFSGGTPPALAPQEEKEESFGAKDVAMGAGKGLLTKGLDVAGGLMEASGHEVDPNMKRVNNFVGMGSAGMEIYDNVKEFHKDPTKAGVGIASSGLDIASNGLDFASSFLDQDSAAAKGMGYASSGMKMAGGGLDMFNGVRGMMKAKDTRGKVSAGMGLLGGLAKGASGLFGILGNAGVDPDLMKQLGGGADAIGGLGGIVGNMLGG